MYALCCGTTIAVFANTMTTMSASRMMTNNPPSMGSSLRLNEDNQTFVHACDPAALAGFEVRGRLMTRVPHSPALVDTSELASEDALPRDCQFTDQSINVGRRTIDAAQTVAEQQQVRHRDDSENQPLGPRRAGQCECSEQPQR